MSTVEEPPPEVEVPPDTLPQTTPDPDVDLPIDDPPEEEGDDSELEDRYPVE